MYTGVTAVSPLFAVRSAGCCTSLWVQQHMVSVYHSDKKRKRTQARSCRTSNLKAGAMHAGVHMCTQCRALNEWVHLNTDSIPSAIMLYVIPHTHIQ
jgi:hypothetical protein